MSSAKLPLLMPHNIPLSLDPPPPTHSGGPLDSLGWAGSFQGTLMDANGKLFQIVLQGWALIHHWPHYTETGHPHPHHPLTPITNTWNKSKQGSAEGNWIKYRGSMQEKVRKKSERRGDLRILMQANKGLYKLKGKREGKRGQLLEGDVADVSAQLRI